MTLTAIDPKQGMTLAALEAAIEHAKKTGHTHLGKVRVGFRGQIQSIEFKFPPIQVVLADPDALPTLGDS